MARSLRETETLNNSGFSDLGFCAGFFAQASGKLTFWLISSPSYPFFCFIVRFRTRRTTSPSGDQQSPAQQVQIRQAHQYVHLDCVFHQPSVVGLGETGTDA